MNFRLILLAAAVVIVSGCTSVNDENMDAERLPADADQSPGTSAPSNISSSSTVVYYTSSGFEPATVTIEEGETVRWVNNASSGMWVGSDDHPRHTRYAGTSVREHCQNGDQNSAAFDQCSTGNQFSFTFEKTGEWGYHNHVAPGDTGTVVVE